jgi:serine/threonine-protein kinase
VPAPGPGPEPLPAPPARYDDLGLIAEGGMAEVRRVHDRVLDRAVAMKILHPALCARPAVVARFQAEARVTGRLDHPGVVAVHEVGATPDGRPYFTMREVRGRTWDALLTELHGASPPGAWGEAADGWGLPRLIDAWRRVCETLAFAHANEVIHRDLKPANVMVGPYGEALVMDWGLARVGPPAPRGRPGPVAGTPMYMAPEQAAGHFEALDPRADVYCLGLLLRDLLTGAPPFPTGLPTDELLARAAAGAPPLPPLERPVAEELLQLCLSCIEPDPARRPPHAGAVAERVRTFQEGARRRARAAELLDLAEARLREADGVRARAQAAGQRALDLRRPLMPWAPADQKRAAWGAEDEAQALTVQAEVAEIQGVEQLRAALAEAPDFAPARHALADRYQARHADAEARRDAPEAARAEALLRAVDPVRHAAWLQGDGRLTLHTAPRARALLYRTVLIDRRLDERLEADLGRTPIVDLRLPHGSWVLELSAPGHALVRYPVRIERNALSSPAPPGAPPDTPLHLPADGSIGRDEVFIPPGWAILGGDPAWPASGPRQRVWVDGCFIQRHPVTHARYLAFLDALVADGDEALAGACLLRAPRPAGEAPKALIGRGADGRHHLLPDADGDLPHLDWPVFRVDQHSARAFAAWEARRTGQPWRLPWEAEREKAARGVDGRIFPWGDTMDASWACVRDGAPGRALPAPILAHPLDHSPYGVRGMAGNVQDWCLDRWSPGGVRVEAGRPIFVAAGPGDQAVVRGGAWTFQGVVGACAARFPRHLDERREVIGFRLARGLP